MREFHTFDFFSVFPHLTALYFEGLEDYPDKSIWYTGHRNHRTIASNLTHLRLYKAISDPRAVIQGAYWEKNSFSGVDFARLTPQLEHLSILGHLGRFSVSDLLNRLTEIPNLKYLDITDGQKSGGLQIPHDRSPSAHEIFKARAHLRRIVFVRKGVGEVFLRGYWLPVAESTGYVSEDISDADLGMIPSVWWHSVPQTGLTPFPSFTP